jgi:hypothetical protein
MQLIGGGGGGGGVPTTRAINTTAPLTGGGDLSADRTLGISAASGAAAGSMSASDKTKLDGIAAGATVNSSDASLRDRSTHTGTQAIATILAAASARFFGRFTGGSGVGEEITGTQATSLLDTFTSVLKGLVPPSGGGTTTFLRADGVFATPPGGGGSSNAVDAQVDFGTSNRNDYAEVTVSASWVSAGTNIVVSPTVPTTTDHDVEDALLEQLQASIQSIDPGVGFVLGVHAPNMTWGRFDFVCIGV